jgi:cephalosporin hydroxylase
MNRELADQLRLAYQETKVIHNGTTWMGRTAKKCPTDAWIYQELICEIKPDIIIETGSGVGGSSEFLADMCTLSGSGRVITVDINEIKVRHSKVTQILGSSIEPSTVKKVEEEIGEGDNKILVILDSDHSYDHVLAEIEAYKKWVNIGSCLIVEDSYFEPTKRAVEFFMQDNSEFAVDTRCEKFLFTFNPGGFLRRVKWNA